MITTLNAPGYPEAMLIEGVYDADTWNLQDDGVKHREGVFSDEMRRWFEDESSRNGQTFGELYESLPSDYGICDEPSQILEKWPQLIADERSFVILVRRIDREPANEGKGGGFRWHKNGPYIGTGEPRWEHFDDETEFDHVYSFNIVQVL